MATDDPRITELEKAFAELRNEVAYLKKCCAQVEKWMQLEVAWSKEVTQMMRQVDWARLVTAYPGGGGANPPQTPPNWPP